MRRCALVSIVIPTMNSALVLPGCLDSVRDQTWKNIETIVVDAFSRDGTAETAGKFGARIVRYGPKQDAPFQRTFGAPHQWNHGVALAAGDYIYMLGSDIRLSSTVIEECVNLAEMQKCDAVIVPEMSYGEGFWAQCKRLQRSLFLGDSSMESPMFISTETWRKLGGLDPNIEGYMDWDFTNRLEEKGFRIGRAKSFAYHYEGTLSLSRLLRKKYIYGKATGRYFAKYGRRLLTSKNFSRFGLLRPSYVKNLSRLLADPRLAVGFTVMTLSEYMAAALGAVRGLSGSVADQELLSENQ